MGTKPLVSICIPTYNGEKYLRQCLETCINQSYSDYEIIICDDGSSDHTSSIIKEYILKSDKIIFFQNEKNLGLVGNWNKCIEKSNGEWIKFVFQDDFIALNCLEKFVSHITSFTWLIVSERAFLLPENFPPDRIHYYKQEVKTLKNTTNFKGTYYSPRLIADITLKNMAMNFIGEPSLIFFRKSSVEEFGYFSNALMQICDLEFALRIAGKYGLTYIPEKLCTFRVHNDSTTNTNIKNNYFELRYVETTLFAWFLLYSDLHKKLRENLGFFQRIKLKIYFRVKVYTAYRINLAEKQNHYLFKESSENFKEITKYKNGNLFVKLINLIKK